MCHLLLYNFILLTYLKISEVNLDSDALKIKFYNPYRCNTTHDCTKDFVITDNIHYNISLFLTTKKLIVTYCILFYKQLCERDHEFELTALDSCWLTEHYVVSSRWLGFREWDLCNVYSYTNFLHFQYAYLSYHNEYK